MRIFKDEKSRSFSAPGDGDAPARGSTLKQGAQGYLTSKGTFLVTEFPEFLSVILMTRT
jgi:hypothetical protein